MESLQTRAGTDLDTITYICGCGKGSAGVDSPVPIIKRGPGRPPTYPDLFARLKANIEINEFTDCWEWQGYCDRFGYPKITIREQGKPIGFYAHRLMLELTTGFYFPFDEAGHLCTNPSCINPDHLEIQTTAFNLSERAAYMHKNFKACMIPVLYPIEGWAPPKAWTSTRALITADCPF